MILDNYKDLIQNLPVRQQSFTTKRDNEKWIRAEKNNSWFKEFNNHHFRNGKLTISRQDIFSIENSPREKIIKTIFWGYPNGMQGGHNSFKGILEKISEIEQILTELKNQKQSTLDDIVVAQKKFKSVKGLGLSTYSKLLYFFDIKISNNPCLILDKRLSDVFKSKVFEDFEALGQIKGSNEKKYFSYLEHMDKSAKRLGTNGENIEQFLFIFGNHLKA